MMMTFVVRLTRGKEGRLTWIVLQVKTGLEVRVDGSEAIGRAIEKMISPPGTGQTGDEGSLAETDVFKELEVNREESMGTGSN